MNKRESYDGISNQMKRTISNGVTTYRNVSDNEVDQSFYWLVMSLTDVVLKEDLLDEVMAKAEDEATSYPFNGSFPETVEAIAFQSAYRQALRIIVNMIQKSENGKHLDDRLALHLAELKDMLKYEMRLSNGDKAVKYKVYFYIEDLTEKLRGALASYIATVS